jgi:hypothetical protein
MNAPKRTSASTINRLRRAGRAIVVLERCATIGAEGIDLNQAGAVIKERLYCGRSDEID